MLQVQLFTSASLPLIRFIVFVVFLLFISSNPTKANPRTTEYTLMCGNVTATPRDLPAFVNNYVLALGSLTAPLLSQGFASHTEGNGNSSTVYTFAECIRDLSTNDCKICVDQMLVDIQNCKAIETGIRSGRLYLGGCFIRFDDHIFQNETTSLEDQVICGSKKAQQKNFKGLVDKLLLNLSVVAPRNGGFYIGSSERNGISAFGLAQCWEYLNNTQCQSCLRNSAIPKAMTCLPNIEGRVLNAGCYLKYSTQKFYNKAESIKSKGCQNTPKQGISYLAVFILGALIFKML